MSQYTWVDIDPDAEDGTELATRLNAFAAAVRSMNKGSSAPGSPTAGMFWVDDSGTPWTVKMYDGSDWIVWGSFNATTNVFTSAQGNATTSLAGLMSAADKTKLDGIEAGATNTPDIPTVVSLVDGATVAIDASLGDSFVLVTTQNPQLLAPSNPVNMKAITIRVDASGGTRTPTVNTGTGGFRFGTLVTAIPSIPSGQSLYIGCRYNSTDNKWDILAASPGF